MDGLHQNIASYLHSGSKPCAQASTGEAVIGILRDLHQNGATICMVTHDPRYAAYADRTIRIFDGQVVEEQTKVA